MPAEKLTKADAALARAAHDLAVVADRLSEVNLKLPAHELRGSNDLSVALKRVISLAEDFFEQATGHRHGTV